MKFGTRVGRYDFCFYPRDTDAFQDHRYLMIRHLLSHKDMDAAVVLYKRSDENIFISCALIDDKTEIYNNLVINNRRFHPNVSGFHEMDCWFLNFNAVSISDASHLEHEIYMAIIMNLDIIT